MLMVKNVGKPYEGEPHVRFDEGKVGKPTDPLYSAAKRSRRILNVNAKDSSLTIRMKWVKILT